jgi:hypothetical protein
MSTSDLIGIVATMQSLRSEETGREWPAGEVRLASFRRASATCYLLAVPDAVLGGAALTNFLDRVAPFGCPVPGSLVRAYSLPDAPFPSILLREHDAGPNGIGAAYNRFLAHARRPWLAALQETGPGLFPVLAWQAEPARRFLGIEELPETMDKAGISSSGVADGYLGRALLLLADPNLAEAWQPMMSLGGVTKIRKITGREFPVWVDLPAHQPALLASPLLARVEQLLAKA